MSLAATPTSSYASVLTLLTSQPVMALGGYQGWDRILDPSQLASLVQQGSLRFFLLTGNSSGRGPGASAQDVTSDLTAWVRSACAAVPASTYQGQAAGGQSNSASAVQLYDCAGAAA